MGRKRTMKVMITPRKPDEVGGYLMMPLVANVPKGRLGWKMVNFSRYARTIVNHDKNFKEISGENLTKVFFTTKEECQEFCDYLNKIEESVGYDHDLYGELIKGDRDGEGE